MTDADLLALAADGDEEAYAAFFRRHVNAITGFAVRRSQNADEVADIVSETFLISLKAAGRYRPETPTALPWLFGIARRVWIGRHRTRARLKRLSTKVGGSMPRFGVEETAAVDAAVDASRQRPALQAALATLPEAERVVLELVAIDGLAPQEVAVTLGITPNAARLRLSRARRRMRERLEQEPAWSPVLRPGVDHA